MLQRGLRTVMNTSLLAGMLTVIAVATMAAGTVIVLTGLRGTSAGAPSVDQFGVTADDTPIAGPVSGRAVAPSGLNQPVVGGTADASGGGWWEVAADGGVFSFGDAGFHGSTGAIRLNQPIVGMAATPSGQGYWLVARDGGIFSFGDAGFHGSTGAVALNQPIVGMAATPSGQGYWLVAADGGVFGFGDAAFHGSAAGAPIPGASTGIASTASGAGYWIATTAGAVLNYGDAPAVNGPAPVTATIVGATRAGAGLRLLAADGSSVGFSGGNPSAAVSVPPATPSAPAPAGSPTSYTWLVSNGDGSPARWNPCAPIHYVTNLAEAPSGAAAVVAAAFARVSAATGISFVDDGSTTEIPTSARQPSQPRYGSGWAPLVVAWARPGETDLLPGGNVIGEGGSSWVEAAGSSTKVYVTGEVVIDPQNTGGLPAGFGAGSTLGELLLHEIGHVVGLGHTTDATQVMYPTLLPMSAAAYGAGDLTGLAHLGQGAGCLTTPAP